MYKILNKEKYLIKGTSPDFTSQNYDWYKNFNIKKYNNNFKIDYLKNRLNLVHMFEIFKFSNTNLKIKKKGILAFFSFKFFSVLALELNFIFKYFTYFDIR